MRKPRVHAKLRRLLVAPLAAGALLLTIVAAPAQATPAVDEKVAQESAITRSATTVRPPVGANPSEIAAQRQKRENRWAGEIPVRPENSTAKVTGEFWSLQLNLCNGGTAGCYRQGQAIIEGGDLIYYVAPDVVTLNEVCSSDVDGYLWESLAYAWPNDTTYLFFSPAYNASSQSDYQCTDGRGAYGNAVIGRFPAGHDQGAFAYSGRYTPQDSKNEKRTFGCVYAVNLHLACATHLSAESEPIALQQCQIMMSTVVPYILSQEGFTGRTIMAGDLNMEYDTSDPENVQNCVPSGYTRKGDGGVQHTIYSNDHAFISSQSFGLTNTDKDGWLVRLNAL
ncbi:endonuclease/exonuclease/phosphatase family protein [Micromonospora sp. NPDC050187]|uniref:endonuclease/exonuclease/phosphatase family protein n=1 Tax=Micromonospora sp. NPDC050187 TaxID=3364277 RepID=UPI0037997F8D